MSEEQQRPQLLSGAVLQLHHRDLGMRLKLHLRLKGAAPVIQNSTQRLSSAVQDLRSTVGHR